MNPPRSMRWTSAVAMLGTLIGYQPLLADTGACCTASTNGCSEVTEADCSSTLFCPAASAPWQCDGDVNGNGIVSPTDVNLVKGHINMPYNCIYDVNCDGMVSCADKNYVLARVGTCDPPQLCPGAFQGVGTTCGGVNYCWNSWGHHPDCNSNGTVDDCDIDDETSADCNTNGLPDECEALPAATHWESCAVHDPSGDQGGPWTKCMEIEASPPPNCCDPRADTQIECRLYGIGQETQSFHQIVIDLDGIAIGAVTLDADCADTNGPYSATVSVSTDCMTVTAAFDPPLPNTHCCTMTLGGGASGSQVIKILGGDVNGSGRVNATDKNLIKGKMAFCRSPLVGDCFFYDVNMSGEVNATDKNLVKGHIGDELDAGCP
ncbi:MAG: hypothetical protein IID40_00290 [Planctomycetes bacterium]|nr:hypothetical protein [Planctomycetota bacterium]